MNMILHGDCLDELKSLEDSSIDFVCTDPPYGYSFMGKDWDRAVPSVEIWEECLRVLKPGAFACVMSAPRSDVQNAMISRLMEAGFRLDFTPIYWTYASGFPKASNIGKLVDKRLGAEREVVGIDKWAQTLPFLIVPKASKSEKNKGLDSFEPTKTNDGRAKEIDNAFQRGSTLRNNHHPTVKPLKLMSYLITLFSRPGDTVLDPFAGSGTTCVAAKELGREYIGIEREAEYVEIAEARLNASKEPEPTLL